jgi:hypothetical protein
MQYEDETLQYEDETLQYDDETLQYEDESLHCCRDLEVERCAHSKQAGLRGDAIVGRQYSHQSLTSECLFAQQLITKSVQQNCLTQCSHQRHCRSNLGHTRCYLIQTNTTRQRAVAAPRATAQAAQKRRQMPSLMRAFWSCATHSEIHIKFRISCSARRMYA